MPPKKGSGKYPVQKSGAFTPEVGARIESLAEEYGTSQMDVIRILVDAGLKRFEELAAGLAE